MDCNMETKYTMTVLQHTVEYSTENVVFDEDLTNQLHDIVADEISANATKGSIKMYCVKDEGTEDENDNYCVEVQWKIVNPWKEIASKLYWWLMYYMETRPENKGHQVYNFLKAYEQLKEKEDGNSI